MAVQLNDKYLKKFISEQEYLAINPQIKAAHDLLHNSSGLGNDFLGWLNLPTDYDKEEFSRILSLKGSAIFAAIRWNGLIWRNTTGNARPFIKKCLTNVLPATHWSFLKSSDYTILRDAAPLNGLNYRSPVRAGKTGRACFIKIW